MARTRTSLRTRRSRCCRRRGRRTARRLAYVSFEGESSGVFVQTLKTGTRERISAPRGQSTARPRSRRTAGCSRSRSRATRATSTSTRSMSRRRCCAQLTTDAAIDTEAAWSRRTAARSTSTRTARVVRRSTASAPSREQRAQRVTFEGTYNARPRVSPDGKQLAIVTARTTISDRRDGHRERQRSQC